MVYRPREPRIKPGPKSPPLLTSGRPKALAEIVELARSKAPAAIERLYWLMHNAQSEQTQAYCAEALLSRGYGRPPTLVATADVSPKIVIVKAPEKVINHAP